MRVALVTCAVLPEPDPDQEPLLAALRAGGLEAELLAWDAAGERPEEFDLCILRSCWNYHRRPEAFLEWIEHASAVTRLVNPAPVIRWNLHKRYLGELAARGLPTVPTVWVAHGSAISLAETLARRGWSAAVVKPCVSAASCRTRRFAAGDREGQAFLDALVRERDAMIQRYLGAVDRTGEKALVWIAGRWTHAVKKSPRFAGGVERVSEAQALTPAEEALAARALAGVPAGSAGAPDGLLYARLDLIPDDDGTPLVSELELIEPSLFLIQHPPALERLVGAIGAERGRPRGS